MAPFSRIPKERDSSIFFLWLSNNHPVFAILLHLGEALQLPAQQLHLLLASGGRFGHGGPL